MGRAPISHLLGFLTAETFRNCSAPRISVPTPMQAAALPALTLRGKGPGCLLTLGLKSVPVRQGWGAPQAYIPQEDMKVYGALVGVRSNGEPGRKGSELETPEASAPPALLRLWLWCALQVVSRLGLDSLTPFHPKERVIE